MTSTTNGTASFSIHRTGDVFTDVGALLRVALRELEVAGHGACTLAGRVGDALGMAKRLAPAETTKGQKDNSPPTHSPRGTEKEPTSITVRPPLPTDAELNSMRAAEAIKLAAALGCVLPAFGVSGSQAKAAIRKLRDNPPPALTQPPTCPAETTPPAAAKTMVPTEPVATKDAMKLGKDRLLALVPELKAKGLLPAEFDPAARGGMAKMASAVSKASGYAAKETEKKDTAPKHPAKDTVLIADGNGGTRDVTADDVELLMAVLDRLTSPAARKPAA
jgi:hypothetical protein